MSHNTVWGYIPRWEGEQQKQEGHWDLLAASSAPGLVRDTFS